MTERDQHFDDHGIGNITIEISGTGAESHEHAVSGHASIRLSEEKTQPPAEPPATPPKT